MAAFPLEPAMSLSAETRARIEQILADHRVVLFMKGNPQAPQCGSERTVPQLRQKRIDGGLSVRHAGQLTSNPAGAAGVGPGYGVAPTSDVPQLRQKPAPGGLS